METENDFSYMENLPEDILIEVLTYLSPKMLKVATLVCSRWNDIIRQSMALMKHYKLNLCPVEKTFKDKAAENELLLRTTRKAYQSVRVDNLDIKPIPEILKALNLRSFHIGNCGVSRQALVRALSEMRQLESLRMELLIFDDGQAYDASKQHVPAQLTSLKDLELKFVDAEVFKLFTTNSLKTLTVLFDKIQAEHSNRVTEFFGLQSSLENLSISRCEVLLNESFLSLHHTLKELKLTWGPETNEQFENLLISFVRSQRNSLEVLCLVSIVSFPIQFFVLTEMVKLKTLTMPLIIKTKEQLALIEQVQPLRSLRKFCDYGSRASLYSYNSLPKIFPNLTSIKSRYDRVKLLATNYPQLEVLDTNYFDRNQLTTSFPHLKELRVDLIAVETAFNTFLNLHSETLERLYIGKIEGASFSRGVTVDSIKRCTKLKFLSISSDSPIATRMIGKIKKNDSWIFESLFPIPHLDPVKVVFKMPEDQAVFEEKCSTWNDQMIRDINTVDNYGLNAFVNKFK